MNEEDQPWYETYDVVMWSWIALIYVAVIIGIIAIAEAVV